MKTIFFKFEAFYDVWGLKIVLQMDKLIEDLGDVPNFLE